MKKLVIILAVMLIGPQLWAQDSYPVFSYGNDTVFSNEFLRVFNKNKRGDEAPSQAEIEEYLDLYIKFKLKVSEAYARQMDTVPSFINELAGYRKQLAQPYLTDKEVNNRLVKEAYERSTKEVNASHLLILCKPNASPEDSLAAYNKINNIRRRIVEGGQDFEDLAFQLSEDPSAKNNKGNLGYFTAFQMIYPFENAAFNTPVGEVSQAIRTRFGYHLVYVKDRRESLGDVQVGHIMIKYYNEGDVDSAKRRIDAVYSKLEGGEDWTSLVEEFSEDFSTNDKDGVINWFNRTSSNVPATFKDAAYGLDKIGDYSEPIKTKYGWHILRKVGERGIKSFDEMKMSLERRVERDSRSELNKAVVLERVKKENNFKEIIAHKDLIARFDSSILIGSWKAESTPQHQVLFSIQDESYTMSDFASYVQENQSSSNKSIEQTVLDLYHAFVDASNMDYEEAHLEEKYQDFKYIMQEYRDGILLFELTDREVWSKAIEDSLGLRQFYADNQNKYMWDERAEMVNLSFKDAKTAKKGLKLIRKKGLQAAKDKLNTNDALSLSSETSYVEKKNFDMQGVEWAVGVYKVADQNNRIKYVQISRILEPETKPLEKNLGQVTSDYQQYLERKWLKELEQKYPVEVFTSNVQRLYQ